MQQGFRIVAVRRGAGEARKCDVPQHRQWFNQLKNTSYGPNGYPWTRLGYTYDWGNPQNEVGLSEYVINKNAETKIRETQSTKEYCRIN